VRRFIVAFLQNRGVSQQMNGRITMVGLLMAATLILTSGCGNKGPKPVSVSGTVTIDGKPLAGGFLRVVSESGRPSGATIGADGRFTLGCFTNDDGCLPGTHKVEVQGFKQLSETARQWLAPKKYANLNSSGLTVTIDGPTDTLQINLTWGGSAEKGPFVENVADEARSGRRPGYPKRKD
jgi:hypothetical protein